jgi:hypothetical protein
MADYIVRSTAQKNVYEVHKFNGNETPEITYTITIDHNNKWKCNCPSGANRGGWCIKHHKFVKEYRKLERQGKTLGNIISFEE